MERTYSKAEISKVSRVSVRQLQWADERGVICPQKIGHRHQYSAEQVLMTCLLFELKRRRAFAQFARAKAIVRYLKKSVPGWIENRIVGMYLVYEMKKREFWTSEDEYAVLGHLNGATNGCHLILIDDWIERMDNEWIERTEK